MARAQIEPIRSLAFGSISASYAAVGTPSDSAIRIICFTNDTEGDKFFSRNGSTDEIVVLAGSFKLFDIQSNINPRREDKFVFDKGTQFSVKQITAPVSGSVYIEMIICEE